MGAKKQRLKLMPKLRPFLFIGALNTAIGLFVFLSLAYVLKSKMDILIVFIVSTVIAIFLGYSLQRVYVWRSKVAVRRELPKYITVSLLQASMNYLSLLFFVKRYGYNLIAVQLSTTITLVIIVFFAHGKWTFKNAI